MTATLLARPIMRSTFLSRVIGGLMLFAALGWLTLGFGNLLFPGFGRSLYPYILLPGTLGEGSLTFWLLVMGVNAERWAEQAGVARDRYAVA